MPIIAFRSVHAAIDLFKQSHDPGQGLPFLSRLQQYETALAPPVVGTDIDQQAMVLVGCVQIEEQRFRSR